MRCTRSLMLISNFLLLQCIIGHILVLLTLPTRVDAWMLRIGSTKPMSSSSTRHRHCYSTTTSGTTSPLVLSLITMRRVVGFRHQPTSTTSFQVLSVIAIDSLQHAEQEQKNETEEGSSSTANKSEVIGEASADGVVSSSHQLLSSSPLLVDLAASMTQENCQLLGVKSLGVDYGLVRTGLAVTVGYEPQPLAILKNLTDSVAVNEIVRYAEMEQVQRIVVGLPLHKNGTIAEQTNLTLSFGKLLVQEVWSKLGESVPIVFFDERYTSKEAEARARSRHPHSDNDLYGTLDADAACIILENYYNDNGSGAHVLELSDDEIRRQCLERFMQKQQAQESERQAILQERESRMQRRKDAIERAKRRQDEERSETDNDNIRKKKRKKKNKRRR